jgi:drug/metabolite transporter (DMT)-like permease
MNPRNSGPHAGIAAALAAAFLFGASTPLAKALLSNVYPWLLAALLYLGSGLGLSLYRGLRRASGVTLTAGEWPWFAGAILAGGVIGPVLLMFGLTGLHASDASLLLNAESVFTALPAWLAFRESVDRLIALGMALIIAGALVLSWPEEAHLATAWPALAVLGACFAWSLDNNLIRQVSLADATWIAAVKGWVAGGTNLALALLHGTAWPSLTEMAGALLVGWLAYGVSLSLFVVGFRHLGAARTGAYFSVAPFFGAALAIPLLGEPVDGRLLSARTLMAMGVWLHLTERHSHNHTHEALEHAHEHVHDEHHRHDHDELVSADTRHSHWHRHEPLRHTHPHFPDAHHRHHHSSFSPPADS